MSAPSSAFDAASSSNHSAQGHPEWGFFLGLLAAILLGAASALSMATVAPGLLPLSILGAASFLMPLLWALQVLHISRRTLLWLTSTLLNSAWLVALLGGWLQQKTHHRPLGGATFAVIASLLILTAGVLSARAVSLKGSPLPAGQRIGKLLFGLLLISGGLGTVLVVGRAVQADASAIRHVVEALGVVGAVGLGARAPTSKSPPGPPWLGWAAWVVVGACTAYAAVQYPEAASQVSPVLSGLLPLFR